jgi:type IV pilus assembly protein PilB
VLSTLHTNDAPSAIVRLTEMGIEPFLVGSALDCVLAQRLARKLCSKCKEAYKPTPQQMIDGRLPLAGRPGDPRDLPARSAAPPARRPATRAGWPCTR